jgi:phage tail protein X
VSTYRTIDGDMVDAICKAHYGREDMTPTVYGVNPGLAEMGPILPKGIIVTLPDVEETTVRQPIRLWG